MDALIKLLAAVPFWAWVIVPVILVSITTYMLTENTRYTFIVAILAFLVAWLTAGFHFWEVYIHNHFIGNYDRYGLPTNFSRSGWYLLIDAWPLWLLPSITTLLIATVTAVLVIHFKPTVLNVASTGQYTNGSDSKNVVSQLEIKKLQRQLDVSKKKMREMKEQRDSTNKPTANNKELRQTQADLLAKKNEIQQLGQQIRTLEGDLTRAKALIERLLTERTNVP